MLDLGIVQTWSLEVNSIIVETLGEINSITASIRLTAPRRVRCKADMIGAGKICL
jgi:hypothetical protein